MQNLEMTPYRQVESLLEKMRGMVLKPDAFDRISDQISMLCQSYMAPEIPVNPIPGSHLQPNEQALMHYLMARGTKGATRDGIMAILDHRSKDGAMLHKSVDVYVCRLRKALIAYNVPYEIETIRCRGYRLIDRPADQAGAA